MLKPTAWDALHPEKEHDTIMKKMDHLEVPENLQRNSHEVRDAGFENTAQTLIDLAKKATGFDCLENIDILDVGCGVRFTMTIINRSIPIRSYTGLEVDQALVDFLQSQVEPYDDRFCFERWNAHNEMYNKNGVKMQPSDLLPFTKPFDLIWLFSVFTHLCPDDAAVLLALLRKHVKPNGKLLFSTFIDDDLEGFDDRVPDSPLLNAYYGRKYMEKIVIGNGWKIDSFNDKELHNWIQHYIVCSPA